MKHILKKTGVCCAIALLVSACSSTEPDTTTTQPEEKVQEEEVKEETKEEVQEEPEEEAVEQVEQEEPEEVKETLSWADLPSVFVKGWGQSAHAISMEIYGSGDFNAQLLDHTATPEKEYQLFSGKLSEPVKEDENIYSVKMEYCDQLLEPGEFVEDEYYSFLVVDYPEFADIKEFTLYTPGLAWDSIPASVQEQIAVVAPSGGELTVYVLVSESNDYAFVQNPNEVYWIYQP